MLRSSAKKLKNEIKLLYPKANSKIKIPIGKVFISMKFEILYLLLLLDEVSSNFSFLIDDTKAMINDTKAKIKHKAKIT